MGIKTAHKFHETAKVLLGNGSFASLIKRIEILFAGYTCSSSKIDEFHPPEINHLTN